MSLFVGSLSFGADHPDYQLTHRLGILIGSLLSAMAGFLVLWTVVPKPRKA
ncbi:MAG: Na+/H+ antiporter NhaA [Arenimonas sp.]